jgi:ribosomal protein S27AE
MYEIKCNDVNVDYNYVGHTTNFRVRKSSHKSICNDENAKLYNIKIYKCIRENGGWDNWAMLPLEEYPCETPIQSRIREQYWIDIKQAKLNCVRAHNTIEEEKEQAKDYNKQYRQDNRKRAQELQKHYYNDHKEAILEKQKQLIICECGVNMTAHSKRLHIKTKKHLNLMAQLNL